MIRSAFESQVTAVTASYTDSNGNVWTGTPLHRIAMWGINNGAISTTAIADGYVVKVIAADGSTIPFNDTRIAMNTGIFIANKVNGTAISADSGPLRLTGTDLVRWKRAPQRHCADSDNTYEPQHNPD